MPLRTRKYAATKKKTRAKIQGTTTTCTTKAEPSMKNPSAPEKKWKSSRNPGKQKLTDNLFSSRTSRRHLNSCSRIFRTNKNCAVPRWVYRWTPNSLPRFVAEAFLQMQCLQRGRLQFYHKHMSWCPSDCLTNLTQNRITHQSSSARSSSDKMINDPCQWHLPQGFNGHNYRTMPLYSQQNIVVLDFFPTQRSL